MDHTKRRHTDKSIFNATKVNKQRDSKQAQKEKS